MSEKDQLPYTVGSKPNTVRIFRRRGRSSIYVRTWCAETGGWKKRSLGHDDVERAMAEAARLHARLVEHKEAFEDEGSTPLIRVLSLYERHKTPTKSERQQAHDRRCMEMFARFFGSDQDAEKISQESWNEFVEARSSGTIDARGRTEGHPDYNGQEVGPRTVARDLKLLHAILRWGTNWMTSDGYLLTENVVRGYEIPKEQEPARPVVDQSRYEAMLDVASDVDWRFELALILAHETGHRISAIRRLRWSDVDLDAEAIQWRAGEDKIGKAHLTAMSEPARRALQKAQKDAAAIGEAWIFPAPEDASEPCSRHLMRNWWLRAEELAGLEHEDGLGWHGLRRKFASEHKHTPLKTLCDLGGWKTHRTVLECYQRTSMDEQRDALNNRGVYRETGSE